MQNDYSNAKFTLTPSQREVYLWLKKQELNTDDDTLIYWSRRYSEKRLKDVVCLARKRRTLGHQIRNIGGWIHKLLMNESPVEDDHCKANRDFAKSYSAENKWYDLKIYEQYVRDVVTWDDISLMISPRDFAYALESLHERSQTYKKSSRKRTCKYSVNDVNEKNLSR